MSILVSHNGSISAAAGLLKIGQSVDWQVQAAPDQYGFLLAAASAVNWDKDREIIRFPHGCAGWDHALGDPSQRLVILRATWHESKSWPRLAGVVEELYDVSVVTFLESGCVRWRQSSFQYRPVELATRRPKESCGGEPGRRVNAGCVVGLRVMSVAERTDGDTGAYPDYGECAVCVENQ